MSESDEYKARHEGLQAHGIAALATRIIELEAALSFWLSSEKAYQDSKAPPDSKEGDALFESLFKAKQMAFAVLERYLPSPGFNPRDRLDS